MSYYAHTAEEQVWNPAASLGKTVSEPVDDEQYVYNAAAPLRDFRSNEEEVREYGFKTSVSAFGGANIEL